MNNNINLILPSIQSFCRQGFMLPQQKQALKSLADAHGIDWSELEPYINAELKNAREATLDTLYKASKQPDAAICNEVKLYTQSRRQFPDVIKMGTLTLKLNKEVHAPAFVPIQGMRGLCVKHSSNEVGARNMLLNAAMRIMLSVRRSLTKITLIDPVNMGDDFLQISGLDRRLLTVIRDDAETINYLQKLVKDLSDFNFNEMGNKYEDLASYNRDHITNARPYELVIIPEFAKCLNKNTLPMLERIGKLASKAGVFFMLMIDEANLQAEPGLLNVFQKALCLVDISSEAPYIETSEVTKLFNNAYDFTPQTELEFNDKTIAEINHEFDPESWNIAVAQNSGLLSIDSICATLGTNASKGKKISVQLEREGDNVLVVSSNASNATKTIQKILSGIASAYRHEEISYMFFNCTFVGTTVNGQDVKCNVHTDKLHYLQGLLKNISEIVESRKLQFKDLDYVSFRNSSEEQTPRILCVVDGIEKILDSDDISAVESVMILDTLLSEAGRYGVHFILAGCPTFSFYKINIADNINYKMLSSMDEMETSQIGLFLSAEENNHIQVEGQSLLNSAKVGQNVLVIDLADDNDAWMKACDRLSENRSESQSINVIEDFADNYPTCYNETKVSDLPDSAFADSIPLGIVREFTAQYACLKRKDADTFVVGNDTDSIESILKSVYEAAKRTVGIDGMSVYDASNQYLIGIPGLSGVAPCSQLSSVPVATDGIVCLLNMDECDFNDSSEFDKLMDRAAKANAKVVMMSKTDLLAEGKIGLFQSRFREKIALVGAPDTFVSPFLLVANKTISSPQHACSALLETIANDYSTEINSLWLFK
ncbi:MAG: hypothetical protein MJZ32_10635 [Bacteroidaceae bacterium]|nr:hypothetical protein [Bacteroidaceae bacterium]